MPSRAVTTPVSTEQTPQTLARAAPQSRRLNPLVMVRPVGLTQFGFLDLADGGFREIIDEFDLARPLESGEAGRRNGQ